MVAVWQSLTVMRLQLSIGPNSLRLALAMSSPPAPMIGIVQEIILLNSRKDITMVKYSRAKEILRNGAAL